MAVLMECLFGNCLADFQEQGYISLHSGQIPDQKMDSSVRSRFVGVVPLCGKIMVILTETCTACLKILKTFFSNNIIVVALKISKKYIFFEIFNSF